MVLYTRQVIFNVLTRHNHLCCSFFPPPLFFSSFFPSRVLDVVAYYVFGIEQWILSWYGTLLYFEPGKRVKCRVYLDNNRGVALKFEMMLRWFLPTTTLRWKRWPCMDNSGQSSYCSSEIIQFRSPWFGVTRLGCALHIRWFLRITIVFRTVFLVLLEEGDFKNILAKAYFLFCAYSKRVHLWLYYGRTVLHRTQIKCSPAIYDNSPLSLQTLNGYIYIFSSFFFSLEYIILTKDQRVFVTIYFSLSSIEVYSWLLSTIHWLVCTTFP